MFSEIEEIKDTLNYVDYNWNDVIFSDLDIVFTLPFLLTPYWYPKLRAIDSK